MKKILSCFVALFAAVSLYATDLNIYASGLKVHQTASGATIDYMLNAPATTLNVYIYGPANTVTPVKTIDLSTDAANLTKGAHAGVAIDLTGLPDAVYTWAIEAGAAENGASGLTLVNDPVNDGAYQYYLPQDVAVDNSFESPFFGRVYVSESTVGQSDGSTTTTKNQARGVYIYNADLTFANGQATALIGYDGGLGGTNTGRAGFQRMAVDEKGFVYIASRDDATKGVYRMDPANPSANFETVLSASAAVDGVLVLGNKLITLEGLAYSSANPGHINTYSLSTLPVGTPLSSIDAFNAPNSFRLGSGSGKTNGADITSDRRGGWWITQSRWAHDTYPSLLHVTAGNEKNFEIKQDVNTELLSNDTGAGVSYRGVITVNPQGNLLAMGSNKRAVVFLITYDGETGEPSLTKLYETANLGTNIDGIDFDVAGNLYVASASVERFYAYATPKGAGENIFKTPAPASEYIALPCIDNLYEIGSNQAWATNAGVAMTKVATNVFEKEIEFTDEDAYFTFSTTLGENWGDLTVYGAGSENYPVHHASVANIGGSFSFGVHAGTYVLRVDLNENKLYVNEKVAALYEVGENQGWNLGDKLAMTKVADNVFEEEITFTHALSYLAFTTSTSTVWSVVNNHRFASDVYQERVDDGSEVNLLAGDGDATLTILPGVYTIRVDFNTNKITVTQSIAKVSFDSEIGYATYYNGTKGYTMPANVTGYAFNYPGAGLTQAFEAGEDVPAGVALVLAGPAGTFDLVLKTGVPAVDLANQLRGTDADELTTGPTAGSYLFYGLSLANPAPELLPDPTTVGFYWMAENGAAFTNKAHKAYLALPENFLAPARILFNENGATGIENVEGQEKAVKFIENGQIFIRKDGVVYDAMGRVIR